MAERIKISKELTLYSGDVITMRADDGTYLKRFFPVENRSVIECWKHEPDECSEFVVTVIGKNEIFLQAENGKFLKRWGDWNGMTIIAVEKDEPDAWSTFIVQPTDIKGFNNTIILKCKDNDTMIKRYYPEGNRSIMVNTNQMSENVILTVDKIGTKCREVVEDIQFDMPSAIKEIKPEVIVSQEMVNSTTVAQTQTFKVNKSVETSKSFTWELGFSFGIKTEFTAGIPLAATNTTEIDFETHFSAGGTKSSSERKSFEAVFPVVCPPKRTITATASIQKGTLNVKYNAVITRYLVNNRGNTTKYTYKIPGVFKSVNVFDLKFEMKESR